MRGFLFCCFRWFFLDNRLLCFLGCLLGGLFRRSLSSVTGLGKMEGGVREENGVALVQKPVKVVIPLAFDFIGRAFREELFPEFLELLSRVLFEIINDGLQALRELGVRSYGMRARRTDLELLSPFKDGDVATRKLTTDDGHEVGRVALFLDDGIFEQREQTG